MGCLLSTSRPREALSPNDNDKISIVNIKTSDATVEGASIPVPSLSAPACNNSNTMNQPEVSTPLATQPEMERPSRPPSRMDWEPTPPQHELYHGLSSTQQMDRNIIPQPTLHNPNPPQAIPALPQLRPGIHYPIYPLPTEFAPNYPVEQQRQFILPRPTQQHQWNPLPPQPPLNPRRGPAPTQQPLPSMPPPPGPMGEKHCMICTSTLEKSGTVYPCLRCKCPYCVDCLRQMFLGAVKDESRMPPRCCNLVHLSVARPYLSSDEISQFKARYEEWSTPNRLYCPVPTCSTFISPRLISDAVKSATTAKEYERQQKQSINNINVVFGIGVKKEVVETQTPPALKPNATPVIVECPTCFTEICTSCKEYAHAPLPCLPENDQLADMLRKWKIKRCPKCRTAVRRMYGCPHIRCRCGAQWCWFCLGPIDECRDLGCPEQEAADREDAGYDTEEEDEEDEDEDTCADEAAAERERERIERRRTRAAEVGDLDATIDRQENLDLGDEPNADQVDPWNCEHNWRKRGDSKDQVSRKLECHRCWKEVTYDMDMDLNLNRLFDPVKAAAEENEAAKAGSSNATVVKDTAPKPGVECVRCGLLYCNDCMEEVEKEKKLR